MEALVYAEYSGRSWIGRDYWDRQFGFLRSEVEQLDAAPSPGGQPDA